jgi:tetratricopeptide (TPR) repeat protein
MQMKNNNTSEIKRKRVRFVAGLVFFGLVLSGCSALNQPSPLKQPVSDAASPPDQKASQKAGLQSGNSFFFFSQSQLYLKKGDTDKAVEDLKQAIALDPNDMFLKRELAQLYWQRKEAGPADAIASDLMSKDPDNIENLILYARIKHGMNELDEAKSAYEKVIAKDPRQKNIYLLLGGLYMDESNPDFAIQVYRKLVKQFPEDFAGYYLMAQAQTLKGNPLEAEQNFLKALQIEPDLDEARYELIELYKTKYPFYTLVTVGPGDTIGSISEKFYKTYNEQIKQAILRINPELHEIDAVRIGRKIKLPQTLPQGRMDKPKSRKRIEDHEKIIGLYQEMLAKNPQNIRASMELGCFYWQLGRSAEADKIFTALGERSKIDKRLIQHVLQFYLDQQKYDEALVILNQMLRGAPNSSEIHYIIGIAYDGKKEYDAAIRHLKCVEPDSRFFQNAVTHIAFLYQEAGKTDEAVAYLEEVINRQPLSIEPRLYLGALYEESEMFKDAEAVLKEGIGIQPDNPKLFFRLGVVYDKWGKKDQSIKMMKEAIRLDPKDPNALNYLGYTYADMGKDLDEAEQLILEALKNKPDDGYIIDSLGWVYYQKGDFEKALMYLKKAAQQVPDDPTVLEHLGDAYLKTGNQKKALELYQRSMMNATEGKENLDKKIKELINQGN